MKIDWKRKLTSRKFWAAAAGFVSMLLIFRGKDAGTAQQVTALIMAAASLIAYIVGEGLADCGNPRCDDRAEFRYSEKENDGTEGERDE